MSGTHLRFCLGLYFRPISLQLGTGPKPHPKYADGSTSRPPSSAKTRLTIALKLHLTNKEIPALQGLPYVEKTTKSSSTTQQSVAQVERILLSSNRYTDLRKFNKQVRTLTFIPQSPHIQRDKV